MQTALSPVLTPRQRRIAALVCDGLINKQIAWQIEVSVPAVKQDLHIIYHKLRIANRLALIHTFKDKLPELLSDCVVDQWTSLGVHTPREVLFKRSTGAR